MPAGSAGGDARIVWAGRPELPNPAGTEAGRDGYFVTAKRLNSLPTASTSPDLSPRRINQVTLLLLLVGFGSALVIYLTAEPLVIDPLLGRPLATKKLVHELRVIGGQANVMMAELQEWWGERWHGPNLGSTVAVLTVVATLAFRFFALRPELFRAEPPRPDVTLRRPGHPSPGGSNPPE